MPKLTKQKLEEEGDAALPAKERSFSKILAKDVKNYALARVLQVELWYNDKEWNVSAKST